VSMFESLLFESEGSSLDYKRDQYSFEGASDAEKGELLKDILAFANAWRRSEAYILIGVEDVPGGRSRPVGVSAHLEDAKLQQFVNSKTQRPLAFSYRVMQVDGIEIGVISIPVQSRPFFLRKPFGRLAANTVYIRRGSSTDTADPDEIARMAEARFGEVDHLAKLRERASREWSVIEQQRIRTLAFSFKHRRELTVAEFLHYLKDLSVRIVPNSGSRARGPVAVTFAVDLHNSNVREAYSWQATTQADGVVALGRVSFDRKPEPSHVASPDDADTRPALKPPNAASEEHRSYLSSPTMIESVTMFCDGWAYESSNKFNWNAGSLVCGISGWVEWNALGLHDLDTLHDIGRIDGIEVTTPSDFDLRISDEFKMTLFCDREAVSICDFRDRRYSYVECSGLWQTRISGRELYADIAENFVQDRVQQFNESAQSP
jgi:hypothetical protein